MAAPRGLSEPLVSIEEGEALVVEERCDSRAPRRGRGRRGAHVARRRRPTIAGYGCRPPGRGGGGGRLLGRSVAFGQSSGRLHIARAHRERGLYYRDLYHTIADSNVWYILFFLLLAYVAVSVFFGLLWWAASDACDVGIENFNAAFLFSVETMMTIGYGTRDQFFADCGASSFLIFAQSLIGILLDCVSLGLVYTSLSSGVGRSSTILFSDRAVIRRVGGELYFMFQVVEMRSHQLIEGHVRCYAVRDETDARGRVAPFQQCAMRLDKPDDELGGWLFLALPSVVAHRLDAWSPLVPPAPRVEARGGGTSDAGGEAGGDDPMATYAFPRPLQRASDADAGGRSAFRCDVCGETYEDAGCLARHFATSHPDAAAPARATRPDAAAVDAFMEASGHEIVVVVEGVDPITSNTVQATHSYCYRARDGEDRRDVVWDCDFRPCVSRDDRGRCRIDYAAFHELVAAADGAPPPPPCSH